MLSVITAERGMRGWADVEKTVLLFYTTLYTFCVHMHTHTHTVQVHRACMLATLFIGSIGVAMVFIGHAHENNPRGLIHLGTHHVSIDIHFSVSLSIVITLVFFSLLLLPISLLDSPLSCFKS